MDFLTFLNTIRLKIAGVISVKFVDNMFFYFDGWSIIHFLIGALIIYLLFLIKFPKKFRNKFIVLFIILFIYEIWEFVMFQIKVTWMIPETATDTIYDIIYGMLGGLLIAIPLKLSKKN